MRSQHRGTGRVWWLAVLAGAALSPAAMAVGPDVVLSDITGTFNYGLVGNVRAYAISSNTCNLGNQNLIWANGGSPGLAMNLYRIEGGRMMQIGLGFAKTACCAAAGSGCGMTCNGQGGSVLGAGCLDVYSAGWNGGQTRLAPRSAINGYSGAFGSYGAISGNAIFRRLQVQQFDVDLTLHPTAVWIVEGQYVGTDDATFGNALNNATYKRATMDAGGNLLPTGPAAIGIPAIQAWRDHGLGANQPDLAVTVTPVDVPGEGRYYTATKVRDLGNGHWRYDYAVFNLNSDRSGASFTVPVPAGVTVTNWGYNAPFYHSGEIYTNTPWTFVNAGMGSVTWSAPEDFATNPNTNALRWGTMYNFWFDADSPPAAAQGTLGLFKPGTPTGVAFNTQAPAPGPCYANCDGNTAPPLLTVLDFNCFINRFSAGDAYANCDGSTMPPVLNVLDFNCFMNRFAANCN
jgi:hypothetical protein